MRVFISQPMRGFSNDEIMALREEAFNEFKEEHPDAELIPSFMTRDEKFWEDTEDIPHPELEALGQSVAFMSSADILLLMPGWEAFPGCRIEQKVARYYGIPIEYVR